MCMDTGPLRDPGAPSQHAPVLAAQAQPGPPPLMPSSVALAGCQDFNVPGFVDSYRGVQIAGTRPGTRRGGGGHFSRFVLWNVYNPN